MKRYLYLFAIVALVTVTFTSTSAALAGPPGPPSDVPGKQKGVIRVTSGESIQDAIDAASNGDIIYVEEGNYLERVRIDGKDLKLVAVGDVVIKEPNPSATQWPNPISTVRIENSRSTIQGFTIDVDGGWSGIYAIGGPPYDNGEVRVTIKNNIVKDYNRNGITVNGSLAYGKVINNTVVGEIGPGWANNGIQIGFGSSGFIQGNTVKKNIWTGDGNWTATAILLYDVNDVQVVDNEVHQGQLGIGVLGDNNKIVKNYLDTGTWSVGIYGGENNKIIRNKIKNYDYGVYDGGDQSKIHANAIPVK